MGMFDYVSGVPKIECVECSTPVDGWQSKDGPCGLGTIHYTNTKSFYSMCEKCQKWHEFVEKDGAYVFKGDEEKQWGEPSSDAKVIPPKK